MNLLIITGNSGHGRDSLVERLQEACMSKSLQLWAYGLTKGAQRLVGVWNGSFCTLRTPHHPYLLLFSSFLALWAGLFKQSTVASQDSWSTVMMKSSLEFSGTVWAMMLTWEPRDEVEETTERLCCPAQLRKGLNGADCGGREHVPVTVPS